jgi:Xaa-Pro aminopeptidase
VSTTAVATKAGRIARLREAMTGQGLEAVLITSPENRAYYSGFRGSAGALLISATGAVLATDFRYTEQAGAQAPDYRVEEMRSSRDWLKDVLSAWSGVRRIGFEDDDVSVASHTRFLKRLKDLDPAPELVPIGQMASNLRAVKEPEELVVIQRAIDLADQAMEQVAASLRPGMTERQVAWAMEVAMREAGADALSFETIVAAGPNGARAHHHPTDRALVEGEGVIIDMGALYDGYCSDITRTFFLGKPDARFKAIYDTVLAAQETAEATAVAGMQGKEIDGLARQVIEQAGYGEAFGHSLGHGIGVAVHELPGVGPNSEEPVTDGMVFSVEPGIYLTGWGGVRIEDLVVMENGRPRVLTRAHKRGIIEI